MKDFPILSRKVNGKKLVYFDNAATTQKPRQVIKAITDYYEKYNSNVHRAVHTLSAEATEAYDKAHEKVGKFINANHDGVVFTKNTTEGLNIAANHFRNTLKKGDEIVLTQMEHHSNLVPWLNAAKLTGAKVRYAEIDREGNVDIEQIKKLVGKKTKVVSVAHASNVLGTIVPAKDIIEIAHDRKATAIIDAAQSVPHFKVDVKKLDADLLAFSAHKMLGPTGIGALYGKEEVLERMGPFSFGGDMISEVTFKGASWNELPWKFEAGTPNVAGGIGFGAAVDYLEKFGMDNVRKHEVMLTKYAMERLSGLDLEVYGPEAEKRTGVISFNIKGIHPHDVSTILDGEGIAVRGGHHCAMPLMKLLGIPGSVRASFYIYNTKTEVDAFIRALEKAGRIMHGPR